MSILNYKWVLCSAFSTNETLALLESFLSIIIMFCCMVLNKRGRWETTSKMALQKFSTTWPFCFSLFGCSKIWKYFLTTTIFFLHIVKILTLNFYILASNCQRNQDKDYDDANQEYESVNNCWRTWNFEK